MPLILFPSSLVSCKKECKVWFRLSYYAARKFNYCNGEYARRIKLLTLVFYHLWFLLLCLLLFPLKFQQYQYCLPPRLHAMEYNFHRLREYLDLHRHQEVSEPNLGAFFVQLHAVVSIHYDLACSDLHLP